MSVDFNIEFEGLKELRRDLAKAGGDLDDTLRQAMLHSLQLIASEAKAKKNAPVDTGRLRASIGAKTKEGIREVKGVGADVVGRVGSRVEYAIYQEIGRRPGKMPPIAPIEEWARRHGMAGMGFVIARAIGRRGLKGKRFLERAAKEKAEQVARTFERALDRLLRGHKL